MAYSEKHGAKGQMILQRDYEESNNSMTEYYNDINIEASDDGSHVVLTRISGTVDCYKNMGGKPILSKTQISTNKLIQLIERHGKPA